ncbi:MAG: type 1 glutamine amidotransferase, partial [Methanomicrobium sp.]|nr:type 1 glutamine amidotransferase [Methanomicrobium sp.]
DSYDLLAVLGGSMNVYEDDKYLFLTPEKKFIGEAVAAGKGVLGICLGGQLISVVLGGKVTRNADEEIGWHRVYKTQSAADSPFDRLFKKEFVTFEWHGDTFEIPRGAVHLLTNEACKNQGFSYGDRVLALQNHPEMITPTLESLIEDEPIKKTGRYIQTLEEVTDTKYMTASTKLVSDIMDYFEEVLTRA